MHLNNGRMNNVYIAGFTGKRQRYTVLENILANDINIGFYTGFLFKITGQSLKPLRVWHAKQYDIDFIFCIRWNTGRAI